LLKKIKQGTNYNARFKTYSATMIPIIIKKSSSSCRESEVRGFEGARDGSREMKSKIELSEKAVD
jgi:hypothetical protein